MLGNDKYFHIISSTEPLHRSDGTATSYPHVAQLSADLGPFQLAFVSSSFESPVARVLGLYPCPQMAGLWAATNPRAWGWICWGLQHSSKPRHRVRFCQRPLLHYQPPETAFSLPWPLPPKGWNSRKQWDLEEGALDRVSKHAKSQLCTEFCVARSRYCLILSSQHPEKGILLSTFHVWENQIPKMKRLAHVGPEKKGRDELQFKS